jgi:hypothetical protein
MTIDKSLYELPKAKQNKKNLLASESGAEEAQMELDQLLQQFEEWKKDNKGSWRDFLKSHDDSIRLSHGGQVLLDENRYEQLIDDYVNGIEVIKDESLTDYIKRMGGVKYE